MILGYTKRQSDSVPPTAITPEAAKTLDGLFRERVRRTPQHTAYRYYDLRICRWQELTWDQMHAAVQRWKTALLRQGLAAGDRVAIMLRNCPQWVMFDQAALGLGLAVVPLYTQDRAENLRHVLRDSGARLLIIGGPEQYAILQPIRAQLTELERIVTVDQPVTGFEDTTLGTLEEWLPAHADTAASGQPAPQDLATIVYTSGTTGPPKGVMLSHANVLSNAWSGLQCVDIDERDLLLSFLPLSHTFERTVGYYIAMMAGSTVAYARSIPDLAEDLQTIRPTVLVSVPRIFERIHTKIHEQLATKSSIARALFLQAVETGWRSFHWHQGRAAWSPTLLAKPVLHALVARKIQARLGGRLRFAISGGAPLPPNVARMFIGLGVTIAQGYGLTENSPVVSVNRIDNNDPDSVGEPVPGIDVRIDDNGELLVGGPGVMQGYWKNKQATEAAIDADGWLHTGDKARIEDGKIYITGRIKDIIVLSTGEKVPPSDMEMAIAEDPLFDQAIVIGEGRPYLAALVVLNADLWAEIGGDQCADPVADEHCQNILVERIAESLAAFPGYAKIHRVGVCPPWTIDNGLLTPTLKPKRGRILETHEDRVQALYAGH